MKYILKSLIVGMAFSALMLFTSCEPDDPLIKDVFTVAFIPSQCAPEHSGVLGIKSPEAEYYLVFEGAELLDGFKDGDEVEVDMILSQTGWAVCAACSCPSPDNGAKLRSISKL